MRRIRQVGVLRALTENGAAVDACAANGYTALHVHPFTTGPFIRATAAARSLYGGFLGPQNLRPATSLQPLRPHAGIWLSDMFQL